MLSNLQKAKIKSFLLLLEQPNNLDMLYKIDKDWANALLDHYLNTKPFLTMFDIPFYMKGYEKILAKILRRDLIGSMKYVYQDIIPKLDKPLTYPLFYIPIKFNQDYRIYRIDKRNLPRLREKFELHLMAFNAPYIWILDMNDKYYIFDYEFNETLICHSIKFDYISRFNRDRGLPKLDGYIVLKELEDNVQGLIWMQDGGDKFTDKYMIK